MLGGDVQFGRYVEAIFTNFDINHVFTIHSGGMPSMEESDVDKGLRIQFQYKKSDDEGFNTPNGKIVIYGLTRDTYEVLGRRMNTEVELKVGYLLSKDNYPFTLFKAVMMNKTFEVVDGITVTTIEVLGDFKRKMVIQKMSLNLPSPTIPEILESIRRAMGLKAFALKLDGSEEENVRIIDWMTSTKVSEYGYVFAATPKEELRRLAEWSGLSYRIEGDLIVFTMMDGWRDKYLKKATPQTLEDIEAASTTLVAENKTAPVEEVKRLIDPNGKKINIQETHTLVLNPDTGLIGSPVLEDSVASVGYDEELQEGEEEWEKKAQTVVIDKKTGQPRIDKKTGQVKMTKKPKTRKVVRKRCRARCFINAQLTFDSIVTIETNLGTADGIYRVRGIDTIGDSHGDDWFMDLELNE